MEQVNSALVYFVYVVAVCLRLDFLSYPIMACLKAFSQSELMALHFVVSSKL